MDVILNTLIYFDAFFRHFGLKRVGKDDGEENPKILRISVSRNECGSLKMVKMPKTRLVCRGLAFPRRGHPLSTKMVPRFPRRGVNSLRRGAGAYLLVCAATPLS